MNTFLKAYTMFVTYLTDDTVTVPLKNHLNIGVSF